MSEEIEVEEAIEPEVVTETALVKPSTPAGLDDLAYLKEKGEEIVESRTRILRTLRQYSLRATNPDDWLLFRNREGRVIAYLQDSGCKRILPLWGIDITPDNKGYEKIEADGGDFAYIIRGGGLCHFTGREVKEIEGLRYSTDDFCKGLSPIMKEMRVRQAARANLDGNIARKLTGLSSVPVEELDEEWKGTWKNSSKCAKGKGFGTQVQRTAEHAGSEQHINRDDVPICDLCSKPGKLVAAGVSPKTGQKYDAFWACPDRECKDERGKKWSMKDAEFQKQQGSKQREAGEEG